MRCAIFSDVHSNLAALDVVFVSFKDAIPSFAKQARQICFIGHTHVPGVFTKEGDEIIYYYDDEAIFAKGR